MSMFSFMLDELLPLFALYGLRNLNPQEVNDLRGSLSLSERPNNLTPHLISGPVSSQA